MPRTRSCDRRLHDRDPFPQHRERRVDRRHVGPGSYPDDHGGGFRDHSVRLGHPGPGRALPRAVGGADADPSRHHESDRAHAVGLPGDHPREWPAGSASRSRPQPWRLRPQPYSRARPRGTLTRSAADADGLARPYRIGPDPALRPLTSESCTDWPARRRSRCWSSPPSGPRAGRFFTYCYSGLGRSSG